MPVVHEATTDSPAAPVPAAGDGPWSASRQHPVRHWVVLFVIVLALVAGSAGAVGALAVRQQWAVPAGPSTVPASVFVASTTAATTPTPSPPAPNAKCLATALNAVRYTGKGVVTGQVRAVGSGAVLWGRDASKPLMPASNEKLLTAFALVTAMGPGALTATFATSVVSAAPGRITLIGGGDPYLASTKKTATIGQPATLDDLAIATATALKSQGLTSVTLGFDDSAFAGPAWLSSWQAADVSEVTRISALWVDEGRTPTKKTTPHIATTTPAWDAAKLFAAALKAHGISVTAVDKQAKPAPSQAAPVASIESLPLGDIIAHALLTSDNSATEVLLRHLAIAIGQPGSFDAGAAAVRAWVESAGLPLAGLRIVDGSGLSRANAVPADVLAGAVAWAGASDGPAREVLTRLPVAFVSGTLVGRFKTADVAGARGWVHAKTGSLSGVSTLSGYTVTTSGQVLAFSFMVNNDTSGAPDMHTWLDQMAAAATTAKC